MLENEVIEEFKYRYLNSKNNNYIFCEVEDNTILDKIPEQCDINESDSYHDIKTSQNIKIDLKEIKVKDIISYVLEVLKKRGMLSEQIWLDFSNKLDLLKLQGILREHGIIVQFVFYNLEDLTIEEQMLLNEAYYFNSMFFTANAFIKNGNFRTYFLTGDRVLDSRENYTKIKISYYDKNEEKGPIKKIGKRKEISLD